MIKKDRKYVGKTYPIHDAQAKVTGSHKYLPDMKFPDLLHAKLLFSPIPHGIVKCIDTTKAEALEGVVKVFTHLNTSKKCFNSFITNAGEKSVEDERIFADRVRFVGDRVAAVVAINEKIAEQTYDIAVLFLQDAQALLTLLESKHA